MRKKGDRNYSESEIKDILTKICERISEGESLRAILRDKYAINRQTFFNWINKYPEFIDQYARACEIRADIIFDEIVEISDHSDEDHTPFTGSNVIQRDRLRVDARKWVIARMNPKKYGEKSEVDLTSKGEKLNAETTVRFIDASKPDKKKND